MLATFELEYYLGRPTEDGGIARLPRRPVYSSIGLDEHHPVMLETLRALQARASRSRGC